MSLGIVGCHRVGKTTLAKAISEKLDMPFVVSDVAGVLNSLDLDASKKMDFSTRMRAQHAILEWHCSQWSEHRVFVTDRTPMDFLMYTMGDIDQSSSDWDMGVLESYANACFSATNRHFSLVLQVEPGIPIVKTKKNTGACVPAFMEKLNLIMKGLLCDSRLETEAAAMPRDILNHDQRLDIACDYVEVMKNLSTSEGLASPSNSLLH